MRARALALTAILLSAAARADIVNIDNAELARLVAQGVPVVDIRTDAEWRSTGVLAGSRLLTFFDAQGRADPARWVTQAGAFAVPGQPLILLCRSGKRSRAAAEALEAQGAYARIYNVSQGVQGWVGEHRPLRAPTAACLAGGAC